MAYRIDFGPVILECDTPEEVLAAVQKLNQEEERQQKERRKLDASEESK